MGSSLSIHALRWFSSCALLLAGSVAVASVAWLVAMVGGAPDLEPLLSGKERHQAAALAAFAASGCAALLAKSAGQRLRTASMLLSSLVAMIGALLLWEWWDGPLGAGAYRPRQTIERVSGAVLPAVLLTLGVLGGLVASRRMPAMKEVAAICLLAVAISGIASYALTLSDARGNFFSELAVRKSFMLLAVVGGWLCVDPNKGFLQIATFEGSGGLLARSLMVPALLLPAMFTFALKHLELYLAIPESLVLTMMATLSGGAIAAMIWVASVMIHRGEVHRAEAEALRHAATRDGLTGLFNRRHFDAELGKAMRAHRDDRPGVSVVMLDVDHFKSYNDNFGHPAGDDVLRRLGRVIEASLAAGGSGCAIGGEEFVMILPETELDGAVKVAERVLREIRSQSWHLRQVTASLGVAMAQSSESADHLLMRADRALYDAKRAGRNRVSSDQVSA